MVRVADQSDLDRRREARYRTRHWVDGESLDREIDIQGILHDLSVGGCCLNPDQPIPLRTPIEVRCDISGIGLRIRGEVVWAEETGTGVYHGIALTGYESEEDAPFHRLYIQRLARQAEGAA